VLFWRKWTPYERPDGSPCDPYMLDFEQFKTLITDLSPWVCGNSAESLVARMFRLSDIEETGLINVRALVEWAGRSGRAETSVRLRVLFCLHAPPLLSEKELVSPNPLPTGEEVATDAVDFFEKYKTIVADYVGY
jgi:TBC1 domain family member 8/9